MTEPNDDGSAVVRPFTEKDGVLYDIEGFILEFDDWTPELAEELARDNGMEALSETHWGIIRFLRTFFKERGKAPLGREIRQGTGMSLMEVERLFPGGLRKGARRVAGLPNPRSCL